MFGCPLCRGGLWWLGDPLPGGRGSVSMLVPMGGDAFVVYG